MVAMLTMAYMTATVVIPAAVCMATVFTAAAALVVSAHVIAQSAAGSTPGSGANQAASAPRHTTPNHVATCRAKPATDGRLATAVPIRAHCATGCAANASANGRPGAATELLADHCAKNPTQGAAHACFCSASRNGSTTE